MVRDPRNGVQWGWQAKFTFDIDASKFRFQSCIEVNRDLLNALDLRRRQIEAALREIFPTREGSKFAEAFHAI